MYVFPLVLPHYLKSFHDSIFWHIRVIYSKSIFFVLNRIK